MKLVAEIGMGVVQILADPGQSLRSEDQVRLPRR